MRLTRFRALTFDCYGTLIDWEAGIITAMRPFLIAHGHAATDGDILARFAAAETIHQQRMPSAPYPEILAHCFLDIATGLELPRDEAAAQTFGASVADWPPFPDSIDALRYLKQHFLLTVVSNVDRGSFAASHAQLGEPFDLIVTAADVGAYKPDPKPFQQALELLDARGITATEIAHVAQSLFHDHVPAKRLGLKTVWIDRQGGGTGERRGGGATPSAADAPTPDLRLPDLAALAGHDRAERAQTEAG